MDATPFRGFRKRFPPAFRLFSNVAEKELRAGGPGDMITLANRQASPHMKQNDRAILQDRVRTLVLRHALEAVLQRLAHLSGDSAEEELLRLEHSIVFATRRIGDVPGNVQLAALVAVEDAVAAVRTAFDTVHQRIETAPGAKPASPTALAA
ncbi:hypothetical protein PUR23_09180 [Methylorubrum populi]|uniref:hypothetical protein n=1 Tax=Methylorubrum populi TaxID=223967 RepID=UPI0031F92C06